MRDVRGRIVAIGWIQLIGLLFYGSLFTVLLTVFSYSLNNVSESLAVGNVH